MQNMCRFSILIFFSDEKVPGPSTPPPTPVLPNRNDMASPKMAQMLKYAVDLSPSISFDSSTTSLSNLNLFKSKYLEDDSGVNLTGATNSRDNLADQLIEEEGSKTPSLKSKSTASSTVYVMMDFFEEWDGMSVKKCSNWEFLFLQIHYRKEI